MQPVVLSSTAAPHTARSLARRRTPRPRHPSVALAAEEARIAVRVLADHHFGGAHRHAAGEADDAGVAAGFRPARRPRVPAILERAEHRAHVILDADVRRELDLD